MVSERVVSPEIQPIVDLVNAAAVDAPSIWDQSVADRRDGYHALVAAVQPGPEVAKVTHYAIDGPDGTVTMRCYQSTMDPPLGIIVFFHGGGWVIGDLDTHDHVCRELTVKSDALVISVDYRLAPETPFPGAVVDSWAALQWIAQNRGGLSGDLRAPIAVCGDSAGGNLAAVMALLARDTGLDLAAQLLVYPAVDSRMNGSGSLVENGEGYVLTRETMLWFRNNYLGTGVRNELIADQRLHDWRASPLLAESLAGVAPAHIITAEFDPLRDEGTAYANALRSAGVDVAHTDYPGMVHIFFQLSPIVPMATTAINEIAAASREAFIVDTPG